MKIRVNLSDSHLLRFGDETVRLSITKLNLWRVVKNSECYAYFLRVIHLKQSTSKDLHFYPDRYFCWYAVIITFTIPSSWISVYSVWFEFLLTPARKSCGDNRRAGWFMGELLFLDGFYRRGIFCRSRSICISFSLPLSLSPRIQIKLRMCLITFLRCKNKRSKSLCRPWTLWVSFSVIVRCTLFQGLCVWKQWNIS